MPFKKRNIILETNTNAKPIDSFFLGDNITDTNINNIIVDYNVDHNVDHDVDHDVDHPDKDNVNNNYNGNKLYSKIEIKNKISNLSENELTEIFKIIKNNNEKYTTNKNGIFINLSTLRNTTISEISNFLIFSDSSNEIIDKEEIERIRYKNIIDNH